MNVLTPPQRSYLRSLAHARKPLVLVGQKGLTTAVFAEIDEVLNRHELVKLKLRAERAARLAMTDAILAQTGAHLVQAIGGVIVIYRRNPEQPTITLP
jgi:RNA-binding protein